MPSIYLYVKYSQIWELSGYGNRKLANPLIILRFLKARTELQLVVIPARQCKPGGSRMRRHVSDGVNVADIEQYKAVKLRRPGVSRSAVVFVKLKQPSPIGVPGPGKIEDISQSTPLGLDVI